MGIFDDLIPSAQAAPAPAPVMAAPSLPPQTNGLFDDLIPGAEPPVAEEPSWGQKLQGGVYDLMSGYNAAMLAKEQGELDAAMQSSPDDSWLQSGSFVPREQRIAAAKQRRAEALKNLSHYNRRSASVPQGPAMENFNRQEGFLDTLGAFAEAPVDVGSSLVLRSLPASAPSIAGGVGGFAVGGPLTAAMGAGLGSAITEYGSGIEEQLREFGADMNDEASIAAVWEAHQDEIVNRAATRAAIVGGTDALTGGLTGKIAQTALGPLKKTAAGTATQMAGGGGGEAAAEVFADEKPVSWPNVLGEVIAEGVHGGIEAGSEVSVDARQRQADPLQELISQEPGTDAPPAAEAPPAPSYGLFDDLLPPAPGKRQSKVIVASEEDLASMRPVVNAEPSEAQKAANNYQLGHVKLHGLDISVESPKGSVRSGKESDGREWSVQMPADYGYIRGSSGKDGDHVDVFIGPDVPSQKAYVIDQYDPITHRLDEHKVILAISDEEAAKELYDRSFSDGSGPSRRRKITGTTIDQLKRWITNGSAKRAFAIQREFHSDGSELLAENALPLQRPDLTGLPEVRRPGNNGLPAVGELRDVPEGYGAEDAGTFNRETRQRLGVLPGQLPLGDSNGAVPQPPGLREEFGGQDGGRTGRAPQQSASAYDLQQAAGRDVGGEGSGFGEVADRPSTSLALDQRGNTTAPAVGEAGRDEGNHTSRAPQAWVDRREGVDQSYRKQRGPQAGLAQGAHHETPEFRNWFKQSKVVDERGAPRVMYHGTNSKFDKFDPSKATNYGFTKGFWFVENEESAKNARGPMARVLPVYLSIQNPIDHADIFDKKGNPKYSQDELIAMGYDGIVQKLGLDKIYIAFKPEQIKSVNNRGTYDPGRQEILAQVGRPAKATSGVQNEQASQQQDDAGRGRAGRDARTETFEGALQRLPDLPSQSPGPNARIVAAAKKYLAAHSLPHRRQAYHVKADPVRGKRIADAYEAMRHAPDNATVKAAYRAMANEVKAQYQAALDMGLKIERIAQGQPDPYPEGPRQVLEDLKRNHIWFYPTSSGFGTLTEITDNPLLAPTEFKVGGHVMLVNDLFRVVHDVFGHGLEGAGFGPSGEENAWQSHVRMFTPLAARAMTSETRGQNSWVNFGPYGEANRANQKETVYADQKTGLLPEWAATEGIIDDQTEVEARRAKTRPRQETLAQTASQPQAAAAGIQGDREPQARIDRGDGRTDLTHWSEEKRDVIDPEKFGTNPTLRGAERERARQPNWVNRSYYGVGGKYRKEGILRDVRHDTSIGADQLYDFKANPLGLPDANINNYEAAIKRAGFKGYWLHHPELGTVAAVYEALKPERVTHEGKQVTLQQAKPEATFFSVLTKAVQSIKQEKAPASQWMSMIKNLPGVKADEIAWTQLEEFLSTATGTVTKTAILDHLNTNQVQVKEVMLGEMTFAPSKYNIPEVRRIAQQAGDTPGDLELTLANDGDAYRALTRRFPELAENEDWASIVANDVFRGDSKPPNTTKFHQYQLHGGENYRELLLTIPPSRPKLPKGWKIREDKEAPPEMRFEILDDEGNQRGLGESPDDAMEDANSGNPPSKLRPGKNFRSSHFGDTDNIVAHVRFNERTVDGKKVLFIEEIQSDWHQKGRKHGYGDAKSYSVEYQNADGFWVLDDTFDDRTRAEIYAAQFKASGLGEARIVENRRLGSVPDAPFKTTWPELAFKRILRYAAERGHSASFNKVTQPESVRKLGEDVLGAQMASVMSLNEVDGGVLSTLKHDEVRRAVIASLPVDVVNSLIPMKVTPDQLLRDPDVVVSRLSPYHRGLVAGGVQSAIRSVSTSLRAKLLANGTTGSDVNLLPTLKASDLSAREIVGLLSPQLAYHEGAALDAKVPPTAGATAKDAANVGGVSKDHVGPATLANFLNWHDKLIGGTGASYQAGFDKIAWTTGAVQVDRYNSALRQAVDQIYWRKTDNGVQIVGYKNEKQVVDTTEKEDMLSDAIGKALADRIIADTHEDGWIEGDDIQISDTGMASFYDKILVNIASKLGKKFDAKVGRTAIGDPEKLRYEGPEVSEERLRELKASYHGTKIWDQFYNIHKATNQSGWTNTGDIMSFAEAVEKYGSHKVAEILGGKLVPGTIEMPSIDITQAMRDSVMLGQPLFKPGEPAKRSFTDYWSAASAQRRVEIRNNVHAMAEQMLGHRIMVQMPRTIVDETGRSTTNQGDYNPNDRTIKVAIDTALSATGTLAHEAIHAMRDIGIITTPEWALLKRAAAPLLPDVRATYEQGYRERIDISEEQLQDLLYEEAVAELFSYRVQKAERRGIDPLAIRLINKIKQFLEALRNYFNRDGFRTTTGIFDDMLAGKFKARKEAEGPGRGYYLTSKNHEKPMFTGYN